MTIFDWLQVSMMRLRHAGVDSPRRDCLVLLEDLLEKDRAWVLAHHEFTLSPDQLKSLDIQLKRRENRIPLAYIRNKAWFYGRFFEVNSDVLIPRPESESFIEIIKHLYPKVIVDIGTGSGCLAITTKLELPNSQVIATDTDEKALGIARKNAKKHDVQIVFRRGDLLETLKTSELEKTTFMVNLPYVPDDLISSPEIEHEPPQALFSGADGLDHYRRFWQQVSQQNTKPTYILTESLENQHNEMEKLAKNTGYKLEKTEVLVQLFDQS